MPKKVKEEAESDAGVSAVEKQRVIQLVETNLDRKVYRSLKRDLIGIEEENVAEIILQKCSGEGDYFEIAEHSALIYYYYVCQVLKIKHIRFEDDYDSFFEQYKIGRIRVRGIDTVRERIKRADMYGGEHVMTGRIVFVLKRPLNKERMKRLEKKEAKRRMDLNRTIEVEHSDPLFYRNLSALIKWFCVICSSRLDKLNSQTMGTRLVTLAEEMMMDYLHSTDLPKENLDGRLEDWKSIRMKVYRLKYSIQVVDVAGLWPPEMCLQAFEKIEELKKSAATNLTTLIKEKGKHERATETSEH